MPTELLIVYTALWVEIRLVESASLVPWGPWIVEQAVIRQAVPGVERLSGSGMRQQFISARPPAIIMSRLVP